ncbi:MAG TPA: hypothetical protein VKG20_15835 [Methylomirabilota bacterium]|nr:hypothetical protein [Methylomirabilota bacterium]
MARDSLFPLALLGFYGLAFSLAAFGAGPPAFDDHPGQLYRVWHVLARGPAPWAWNPDWWVGYPELQFYPPGFAYLAAGLQRASVNALSVATAYSTVVWIAYLAPGLTTFLALARVLGSGWLALPGAFVALTLSAGVASGVEGGVHVGMLGARLAWAMVPLLLLALVPWIEEGGRPSRVAAIVVAAIVLMHPAALPAAVTLIVLAALARAPRGARLAQALPILALAAALTAFWTLPLLLRIENTRAIAWGEMPPIGVFGGALACLALIGLARARAAGPAALVVAVFPWAMALVVAADRFVLEPFGMRWLPANRVVDGAWIAVVLAAALGWSGVRGVETPSAPEDGAPSDARFPTRELVTGLAGVMLAILGAWPGQRALTLWPRAVDWPTLGSIERGLRLTDLWAAVREAPAGRVLFVRSAVPLVYGAGREWYRPHTHVTALAPVFSSRAIVNGTFTHPSPIAALTYRGDAGPGPITRLVEQLDGVSLFGRPLDALDPEAFARYADTLGVSVVVAIDEDAARLPFVEQSREFVKRKSPGPFLIYVRGDAVALPRAVGPGLWSITLAGGPNGWVSTRTAYYPLWRARADGAPIEARRGRDGDLQVKLEPGGARAVELDYRPGAPEICGLVVSAGGVVGLVALRRRSRAA